MRANIFPFIFNIISFFFTARIANNNKDAKMQGTSRDPTKHRIIILAVADRRKET